MRVIFLNGWGASHEINRDFYQAVNQLDSLVLETYSIDYQAWLDQPDYISNLATHLDGAVLMGWSLGGLLATQLAGLSPQIKGLVTLGANLKFLASDDWLHGIRQDYWAGFTRLFQRNPERALKRFSRIEMQEAQSLASERSALAYDFPLTDQALTQLHAGLEILRELDNTEIYSKIACPCLHIFGGQDPLVPRSAHEVIKQINPNANIAVIPEAHHAPHVAYPDLIADKIAKFVQLID